MFKTPYSKHLKYPHTSKTTYLLNLKKTRLLNGVYRLFMLSLAVCLLSSSLSAMIRKKKLTDETFKFETEKPEEKVVVEEKEKTPVEKQQPKIKWAKAPNWKRIADEKEKIKKELTRQNLNINAISQLALLELYDENFKDAYLQFAKLNNIKPDLLHQYYEALSLSLVDPLAATKKWKLYFVSSTYQTENKVWRSLGEEVEGILNAQAIEDKKVFRAMVLWFYGQHAYYTSFMLLQLYERYMPKSRMDDLDIEFLVGTKANILIKLGYIWDAIKHLESAEKLAPDQMRKLAISYYLSGQYDKALATFSKVTDKRKKDSTYYYYLSLSHLRKNNFEEYHRYARMVLNNNRIKNTSQSSTSLQQGKNDIKLENAKKLFQRLNSIFPVKA